MRSMEPGVKDVDVGPISNAGTTLTHSLPNHGLFAFRL